MIFSAILLNSSGVLADGRCLFRAIAHGGCLRNGEEAPDENRQRELADELRAQVWLVLLLVKPFNFGWCRKLESEEFNCWLNIELPEVHLRD